jgi:hypothetical protein
MPMNRLSLLVSLLVAPLGCNSREPIPATVVDAGVVDAGAPSPWTLQSLDPSTSSLAAVWGSSSADVYAVGSYPGTIIHTVDHGASWSVRRLDAVPELVAVGGSGPDDIYAAGNRAWGRPIVLHTTDRGATWNQTDLNFIGHARALWSSGPDDTYIVGTSTSGAVIAHTADGGATWTVSPVAESAGLYGIWGLGPDIFVAGSLRQDPDGGVDDAGPSGTVSDSGPAEAGLEGGTSEGGAVVPQGIVLHSVDRGLSWTVMTVTPSGGLFAVAGTFDGARIDAVGDGYSLTESTNSGASWTQYAGGQGFTVRHQLTSVWLPSTSAQPFIAAGRDGLFRSVRGDEHSVVYDHEETGLGIVFGVWGIGEEVYAVGDGVAHRAGAP